MCAWEYLFSKGSSYFPGNKCWGSNYFLGNKYCGSTYFREYLFSVTPVFKMRRGPKSTTLRVNFYISLKIRVANYTAIIRKSSVIWSLWFSYAQYSMILITISVFSVTCVATVWCISLRKDVDKLSLQGVPMLRRKEIYLFSWWITET